MDGGNVRVVSDVLAPCNASDVVDRSCNFNLGVAPVLAPRKDRGLAANSTIHLEHAITLNCAHLAKDHDGHLTDMIDVAYRFGWFTRTAQLPYRGESGVVTYACPSKY